MAERHLLEIRRSVSEELRRYYDELWESLRVRATAEGAHAWRFRSAENPVLFVEFLEFDVRKDPRSDAEIADLLRSLETVGNGAAEELIASMVPKTEGSG